MPVLSPSFSSSASLPSGSKPPGAFNAAQPSTRNTFACAREGCRATVAQRWWRRPGVMLEGAPYCSPHCLESGLRLMAGSADNSAGTPSPHRHRVPLGLLMLAQGWITAEQLQNALQAQRSSRAEGAEGRIGVFLDRQGVVTEDHITRALALQWNCPVFDLRSASRPYITGWVPHALARAYRFVPLRMGSAGELFLAFDGSLDSEVIFAVQNISGLPVIAGLLPESAFHRAYTALLTASDANAEVWDNTASASGPDTARMAQWIFRSAATENPQSVQAFRAMRLHHHFWIRSAAGRGDLVVQVR